RPSRSDPDPKRHFDRRAAFRAEPFQGARRWATLSGRMASLRDELVRVDAQGVAHPIGVVASQRMRPHMGTYRILPAPAHVIIMRYTGEDGQVDAGDGGIVRLGGEIVAAGTLIDIFALIAQTGWRGV